jgi:hypothetical protein
MQDHTSFHVHHPSRDNVVLGVTSHGLSCEVCKYKVHKRCYLKALNNCKWTTLASIGKDIIEDQDGVYIYIFIYLKTIISIIKIILYERGFLLETLRKNKNMILIECTRRHCISDYDFCVDLCFTALLFNLILIAEHHNAASVDGRKLACVLEMLRLREDMWFRT